MEIKYKQFVIIPKRPKMSPGKIASQTAHATFMALEQQRMRDGKRLLKQTLKIQDEWRWNGMCVIVLQCKDSISLLGLGKYLEQWGVAHHLYIDEGITEVPMGTPTALATGIMTEEQFWMFDTMELYK